MDVWGDWSGVELLKSALLETGWAKIEVEAGRAIPASKLFVGDSPVAEP
jgi:hypothetical protein